MKYSRLLKILCCASMLFSINSFAAESKQPDSTSKSEHQKVIEEYKEYVSKIPGATRDEVIEYRKKIAAINKEKRLLYKRLSNAAQEYLKTEQEFKKRLPSTQKNAVHLKESEESAKSDNQNS